MKINFKWTKIDNINLIIIYIGKISLGQINIISKKEFLCSFEILSLKYVKCKTLNEAEIYIESKLTNWISDMMEGVEK